MMNEDRFWEASIAETVRGETPPDLTSRVLKELAHEPEPAAAAPRKKGRVLRLCLELAAAACVAIAIGWATGLLRVTPTEPVIDPEPRNVAAAAGTEYLLEDDVLVLRHGWLLVTTGAPDVRCGDSRLTGVDGRILVFAGSMPSREEAAAVADWLKANELEMEMIMQPKRWALGLAMAALVLSGSAVLDGERIEAQEEPAEPKWHEIRSVMDIERLPADALHVRGVDISGAHLEFLAEHKQITALDVANCYDLRPQHLQSLATMPALAMLDIRDAAWNPEVVNYSMFLGLKHLKQFAVDYSPQVTKRTGKYPPDDFEQRMNVTSSLRELSARGVQISLHNLRNLNGAQVRNLASNISTLRELDLTGNSSVADADIKALAEHPNIQSLKLSGASSVTELGIAYLARANKLKHLAIDLKVSEPYLFQIGQLTNLETLKMTSRAPSRRETKVFSALKNLRKLKSLDVLFVPGEVNADAFAPLADLTSLHTLRMHVAGGQPRTQPDSLLQILRAAQVVGVARLEISDWVSYGGRSGNFADSEEFKKLQESPTLKELYFRPSYYEEGFEDLHEIAELMATLKKLNGLKKITLRVHTRDLPEAKALADSHLKDYEVDFDVFE